MAKGRLLGRETATSLRLNDLSERAELAYYKAFPFTDRDGRLPGDPRKLKVLCWPARDWSSDDVAAIIEELKAAGLWVVYEDGSGKPVVEFAKFHDKQPGIKPGTMRYEKEAPSKYLPVEGESNQRTDHAQPTHRPRTTLVDGSVSGREAEPKAEADRPPPSKIREAFARATEAEGITTIPVPRDLKVIAEAESLGTTDRFTTLDSLVDEMRRTIRGLKSKSLNVSLQSVVNNLGGDWTDDRKGKRGGNGPTLQFRATPDVAATRRLIHESLGNLPEMPKE